MTKTVATNLYAPRVVVIGPRGSGKTTYLAGLSALAAYKKDFLYQRDRVEIKIEAAIDNPDSKRLAEDAHNLLFSQAPFRSTPKDNIITYDFRGKVEYQKSIDQFRILTTDFPGEALEKIEEVGSKPRQYIEEQVAEKNLRLLVLIADWEHRGTGKTSQNSLEDTQLAATLTELRQIIRDTNNEDTQNFRFAVAINKCERGELWTNRHDPLESIFKRYLPVSTTTIFRIFDDFSIPATNLEFFALSTFGVLGVNDFRPNRNDFIDPTRGDKESVLRLSSPEKWHPYGMLSPIYWLSTGRKLPPHV